MDILVKHVRPLIDNIVKITGDNTIRLAPLTKFPLIRDLIVDRSRMFENLKRCMPGLISDGTFNTQGPGPNISPEKQKVMYSLSTCMTCGCCLEACPQVNHHSSFIGPAAISQVRLFNANPVGHMQRPCRLRPFMEEGGISDCGNSQNCVQSMS